MLINESNGGIPRRRAVHKTTPLGGDEVLGQKRPRAKLRTTHGVG